METRFCKHTLNSREELPPMSPSFHAFVGDGYSNAFEKWTDREMLAKVLDHHLGEKGAMGTMG